MSPTVTSLSTVFLRLWSVLENVQKLLIACRLSMGRLVSVVKHVGVRGCIVCMMYVSMGNFKESVVTRKLPMGKLVGVVKHVGVRECIVCTMYKMYVSVSNFKKSVVPCRLFMGNLVAKTWTARTSLYFRGLMSTVLSQ